MKKIIKKVAVGLCMATIMTTSVSANDGININRSDMSGYEYVKKSYASNKKNVQDYALCENNKSTSDVHTESCKRSKTWGGSVGGSYEAGLKIAAIEEKVSINAEVSYNETKDNTSSHSWTIEPKSKYRCEWGYCKTSTTGTMKKWVNGKVKSSKSVDTYWSVCAYYGGSYYK